STMHRRVEITRNEHTEVYAVPLIFLRQVLFVRWSAPDQRSSVQIELFKTFSFPLSVQLKAFRQRVEKHERGVSPRAVPILLLCQHSQSRCAAVGKVLLADRQSSWTSVACNFWYIALIL